VISLCFLSIQIQIKHFYSLLWIPFAFLMLHVLFPCLIPGAAAGVSLVEENYSSSCVVISVECLLLDA